MPSLSIVRTDFRKILKWAGAILAVLICIFIVFKILMTIKNIVFPPPPPQATSTFGKLPVIDFPQNIQKDFTYEIDTLTGDLPSLPLLTNVYKMEERGPDLLAVYKASNQLAALKFNKTPQQISDFIYKWTSSEPPNQVIVKDIRLDEFNLTSSYLNLESSITERFESETEAKDRSIKFLQELNMNIEDLDQEKTKVEYQILKNGAINSTAKHFNSNIATVYFFQKAKDEVPIVYPQGKNSSMRILIAAGSYKDWVLEANYSNQKILEASSTYPLKSAEQALEDLKNKKAFILSHSGENTNIKIKNVYLALYSEGKLQKYLTPVIVFEGDNNFIAYVPAITDEWFDK